MEKKKTFTTRKTLIVQLIILTGFVLMAMGSSPDAQKAMDDFNDGYQYGRTLR
jgi:hypothetical protein